LADRWSTVAARWCQRAEEYEPAHQKDVGEWVTRIGFSFELCLHHPIHPVIHLSTCNRQDSGGYGNPFFSFIRCTQPNTGTGIVLISGRWNL